MGDSKVNNKPRGVLFSLPYGANLVGNPDEYMQVLNGLVSNIYADTIMHESEYSAYFTIYVLYKESSKYSNEIKNAIETLKNIPRTMHICIFAPPSNYKKGSLSFDESLWQEAKNYIEFISSPPNGASFVEIDLNSIQASRQSEDGIYLNHLRLGNTVHISESDYDKYGFNQRKDWDFANLSYSKELRFDMIRDKGAIIRLGIDLGSMGLVF
jgi:hypothetical protein